MIGTVLNVRYELTAAHGEGPIFIAYSARDQVTGAEISLRIVKPPFAQEDEFLQKLSNVVAEYSVLHHPGIESLNEVVRDADSPFVVGQLSRGATLSDRIRKLAPFSVPVSVSTAISIAQALDAVHRAGLVHGGITAQNCVVKTDGEVRLQLAGIWKAYSASPTAGAVILPELAPYLAPEVSGGAMPSSRSDVYALGVLLYELLTGRWPYNGDTHLAIALRHSTSPTPSVRLLNPAVPVVLDEIIRKAMSKVPEQRYGQASEMLSDLRILQDALRFGRSLTWPLTPRPEEPETKPVASEPARVAPKMTALRPEEPPEIARKVRHERDIPVWMLVTLAFLFAVVCSLLAVWMIFNLNKPRLVDVPKLRGQSMAEARQNLEALHLTLRIARHEPNEHVEADHVLDESPQPGMKVREGEAVSVILSAGSRYVTVPDLKNLTVDKATSILESVDLTLDPNIEKQRSFGTPEGQIISQNPGPKARVARKSSIHISISASDATASAPAPPSPTGPGFLYTVKVKLTDLTKPTDVKVDMTDERGTRTVFEQTEDSGQQFEVNETGYGDTATFRIYYDGELVKTVEKHATDSGT